MAKMTVSSKGRVVVPADIRKRLGLIAGMRIEIVEAADGVRLTVVRPIKAANIAASAGLVKAPSRGYARSLGNFDLASTL
jgi:antitoxin PrlF